MISEKKLKELINRRNVVIRVNQNKIGGIIRFNGDVGNDDTWQEIEIDGDNDEAFYAEKIKRILNSQ